MNDNIKISIIMPVYKVEKYVGKAIESILSQTLKDFEFLIVDDGTPDKSGEICDRYAAIDKRIHVFHKENGGAPSARNMAIDVAKGKYMYFLDSDDWAEPDMLKDMYDLAEKNSSQLVVTGYYIDTYYSEEDKVVFDVHDGDYVFNEKEDFRKNAYKLFDKNLLYTPWNKLYLSEYIIKNALKFPNTFWDDFPFNLSIVRNIERVSVSSGMYYHFVRARADSETAKYRPDMYKRREEENKWMVDLYKYWGIDDENSREMIARRHIERLVGCIENVTNKNCKLLYGEKKQAINKMISDKTARTSLKLACPRSIVMKCMLLPIKWRSTTFVYLECKFISYIKSKNRKMFSVLKARR